MRLIKILREDQDLAVRFLNVLGQGLAVAGHGGTARPGFFIFACKFIHEYLEAVYFRKEKILLDALEECGFSADDGPVGAMTHDVQSSSEICLTLFEAAKEWQGGNEGQRTDVIWATSEYASILHRHFDMLKGRIHPLLEQSLSPAGEEKAAEALNRLAFESAAPETLDNFVRMVDTLEEEVGNWK